MQTIWQKNICHQQLGFLICDSSEKCKAENGFISSKEIHGSSVIVFQIKKSKILTGNLTYNNIIL